MLKKYNECLNVTIGETTIKMKLALLQVNFYFCKDWKMGGYHTSLAFLLGEYFINDRKGG